MSGAAPHPVSTYELLWPATNPAALPSCLSNLLLAHCGDFPPPPVPLLKIMEAEGGGKSGSHCDLTTGLHYHLISPQREVFFLSPTACSKLYRLAGA